MPHLNNYVVDEILVPVVFLFFLVTGIFGIGFGTGLAVFRARVFRFFRPMNRWISARKNLAPMEARHDIEPIFHKYRRWFSAFFVIGGLFSIIMLAAKVNAAAVVSVFGTRHSSSIGPWVVQSLATFLIMGSVLAIVVGIILGFFPQVLGTLETRTNRWVSSRQMAKGGDTMHLPLDRWFEASPRVAGWILAAASLILTVVSAIVVFGRH
jgi:hypothetical protein